MRLLAKERETLEQFLPGLDAKLAAIPLQTLESPGNQSLSMYKSAGGAGLLIPKIHGGKGATAVQAALLTRALASRSPSLALATTMHQFSVASLIALAESSDGPEWMLLDGIATEQRLMSSAFAEGHAGQSILAPTMKAVWDGRNWRVTGKKQPCSLARSMDLLTTSLQLEHPEKGVSVGVALIPAQSPGISVEPFWRSWILGGAESDAVILQDVEVHPDLVFELDAELQSQDNDLQTLGYVWFEMLLTACYLGVASALVEKVMASGRGTVQDRTSLCIQLESSNLLVDAIARNLDLGDFGKDALSRALITRFAAADNIQAIVAKSVELLGGMAFIRSSDVSYLASATHAIGFHPPSRNSAMQSLLHWYEGQQWVMV